MCVHVPPSVIKLLSLTTEQCVASVLGPEGIVASWGGSVRKYNDGTLQWLHNSFIDDYD